MPSTITKSIEKPRAFHKKMGKWAIITGAGTGIGAGLAKHLANKGINVLAVGRRLEPLQQVKEDFPEKIYPLSADIATDEGIDKIVQSIPTEDTLVYLVQNAAIGVPGKLGEIRREDFEYAIAVNVTAPLMMTQRLLPRLKLAKGQGRILHIGTNIAFTAQTGTATYGITKMAFHRLYQQLKVDLVGTGKYRLFRETPHNLQMFYLSSFLYPKVLTLDLFIPELSTLKVYGSMLNWPRQLTYHMQYILINLKRKDPCSPRNTWQNFYHFY